ncbi:biotin/lipoyl-binding carrier protein [Salinactinospora qingdaonensis]|uniref:Acetyl-CoA carboxylase biotin carboxyl carrier protein subunit n=1 Tax=Salinactinospora qingdaonensis TaxID=702744 RepID=A0ABP7G7K0_9ACTN
MAEVRAEMAANVWKVAAAPGDTLNEGDAVLILESMKMEIPVVVENPAAVVSIEVAEGDVVREGDLLAVVAE